jgi:hypothetical protein
MNSIIIIPSSDDEGKFEDVQDYNHAVWTAKTLEVTYKIFSFDTVEELNAFIIGYTEGVGFLGNGLYFKKQN